MDGIIAQVVGVICKDVVWNSASVYIGSIHWKYSLDPNDGLNHTERENEQLLEFLLYTPNLPNIIYFLINVLVVIFKSLDTFKNVQ